MEDKLYRVIISSGEWEDYIEATAFTTLNKEHAEEFVKQHNEIFYINNNLNEVFSKYNDIGYARIKELKIQSEMPHKRYLGHEITIYVGEDYSNEEYFDEEYLSDIDYDTYIYIGDSNQVTSEIDECSRFVFKGRDLDYLFEQIHKELKDYSEEIYNYYCNKINILYNKIKQVVENFESEENIIWEN